jgi:hypothetical protein
LSVRILEDVKKHVLAKMRPLIEEQLADFVLRSQAALQEELNRQIRAVGQDLRSYIDRKLCTRRPDSTPQD